MGSQNNPGTTGKSELAPAMNDQQLVWPASVLHIMNGEGTAIVPEASTDCPFGACQQMRLPDRLEEAFARC